MMTDAEITALIEEVVTLKKQVSDKDDVIAKLNDESTRLRNKVFGHTSEKHLPFDPAQLRLFDHKEMSGRSGLPSKPMSRRWRTPSPIP